MLQLVGHDWDLNLRATSHPEFDAWRWNDYWVPLEAVVEFKREVYVTALTELARYVPRNDHRNRFLRQRLRPIESDQGDHDWSATSFEMPPGATLEPDPEIGNEHV